MFSPLLQIESVGKVKAHELRPKTKGELVKTLEELKADLAKLRVQQTTGGNAAKVARIGVVRKAIARVLTVTNQKAKKNVSRIFPLRVSFFPLPPLSLLSSLSALYPLDYPPFPPLSLSIFSLISIATATATIDASDADSCARASRPSATRRLA